MKIRELNNNIFSVRPTKSERIEVLYVECSQHFSQIENDNITDTGNLTKEERGLLLSLLDKSGEESLLVDKIKNKIENKSILIPADVFTKTGIIETLLMKFDVNNTVHDIIQSMLEQSFIEKARKLGEKHTLSTRVRSGLTSLPLDERGFIEKFNEIDGLIGGIEYCICNEYTFDKIYNISGNRLWHKLNIECVSSDFIEEDTIIFGKKTDMDKPGLLAIIMVDENDDIIYTVEKNILNLKGCIYDIGFFPEHCYFTSKIEKDE